MLGAYAAHLHALVDLTGIRPLMVVADAGNGMAGHTLPAVFPGGADGPPVEIIGLYTDPDGNFPNHPANPLEPQNLVDAQAAVRERGADLALVFDGDADRCFIIDERGEVVSPSTVTALIASQELAAAPRLDRRGQQHHLPLGRRGRRRARRHDGGDQGRAHVRQGRDGRADAVFGGEHSAHYYFREFWGADTGMLAALHVLAVAGRSTVPLSELVTDFTRYAASGEINSTVDDPGADHRGRGRRVRRPRRGRPARRADGQRAGLVGERPALQHRAAAPAQRRGPHRGADGRAARRGAGDHPRLSGGAPH